MEKNRELLIWYDSPSTTIIFPWILNARIRSTLKNVTPSCLESIKSLETFSYACFAGKSRRVIPAKQNKGFRVLSFVDQATPRFELGKKDLQSPTLPLGHAAKTIPNTWKHSPFLFLFLGGGGSKCLFLLYFHMKSRFLNSLPKRNSSFFGADPSLQLIL